MKANEYVHDQEAQNRRYMEAKTVWDCLNPQGSRLARKERAERIENFWFPDIKPVRKK